MVGLNKIMIFFNRNFFNLNKIFFIYFIFFKSGIDDYIDVYIHKLFQTCSFQIDLGTCPNRGYMLFA